MDMNQLFKLKNAWDSFQRNHPQFPAFLQALGRSRIREGTDILIVVTNPGEEPIKAGLRIKASDLELLESLKKQM